MRFILEEFRSSRSTVVIEIQNGSFFEFEVWGLLHIILVTDDFDFVRLKIMIMVVVVVMFVILFGHDKN